jgi:RNA polymerase sigma-70 factor, ECF subfamily
MAPREEIFEELYRANHEDLYFYIVRSIREESLSHDLLHDTYLNFFQHFKESQPPDGQHGRMYLFRIARNLIINHSKTAYQQRVNLSPDMEIHASDSLVGSHHVSPEQSVVEEMDLKRQQILLDELLAELSERDRSALLLRYNHHMRLEDVADILGLSVSGVSRIIQKSMDFLEHRARELDRKK